jgi:hypothetical protein
MKNRLPVAANLLKVLGTGYADGRAADDDAVGLRPLLIRPANWIKKSWEHFFFVNKTKSDF